MKKKILYFILLIASFLCVLTPVLAKTAPNKNQPVVTNKSQKTAQTAKNKVKAAPSKTTVTVKWTTQALRELYKIPRMVRSTVKTKISDYAKRHGIKVVTPQVVKNARV